MAMLQVSNAIVGAFFVAIALLGEVNAHGQLTIPVPRPDGNGNTVSYLQREPVFTINGARAQYSANAMRCHDFSPGDKTTITAGTNLAMTWTFEAAHPGDCYIYISYDGANPKNFFKIASVLGCGAADGLAPPASNTKYIPIPAQLPPCEHCVLRWEWTAHQQVSNIEFYVQCADIKIVSTAGATKPTPMTTIAGIEHLPAQASGYRQVYQRQNGEEHLVGPTVATYTSCTPGTDGCIGSGTGTGISNPTQSPVDPGTTYGPVPCPSPITQPTTTSGPTSPATTPNAGQGPTSPATTPNSGQGPTSPATTPNAGQGPTSPATTPNAGQGPTSGGLTTTGPDTTTTGEGSGASGIGQVGGSPRAEVSITLSCALLTCICSLMLHQ